MWYITLKDEIGATRLFVQTLSRSVMQTWVTELVAEAFGDEWEMSVYYVTEDRDKGEGVLDRR